MLQFYSEHFDTVELNNTFYRLPTPTGVEDWRASTPEDFCVMRGVVAKRRVAHFGWHYSHSSTGLEPAQCIPAELEPFRERLASVSTRPASEFQQVLINEYQPRKNEPGAGIGWHRDAPPFEVIAGISLGSSCRMRFRHQADHRRTLMLPLPPRSLYIMTGESRADWEHMIPPTKAERYSITFRTLRKAQASTIVRNEGDGGRYFTEGRTT